MKILMSCANQGLSRTVIPASRTSMRRYAEWTARFLSLVGFIVDVIADTLPLMDLQMLFDQQDSLTLSQKKSAGYGSIIPSAQAVAMLR